MKIRLSQRESFLLQRTRETAELAALLFTSEDRTLLDGTTDQFIELRELVSDALLRYGLDQDYIPTDDGAVLEELVDKLFLDD